MIAYDHTRVDRLPVRWRMHHVLSLSAVLVNEAVKRGTYHLLHQHTRIARSHLKRIHEPLHPGAGSVA